MAFVIELLLIGVGLSMDAFAVAVCKGLAMRKVNKKQAVVIGLFFGGFQALMPFIGWALGTQFESYITIVLIHYRSCSEKIYLFVFGCGNGIT